MISHSSRLILLFGKWWVAAWWPTLADGNIRVASGHNTGISSSVTPDSGETSAVEVSRADIDVIFTIS